MTIAELQKVIGTKVDGRWGPASRAALLARFTNTSAAKITTNEMQAFAERLGCTLRQLAAVAAVESSGSGFDRYGRPKILYERHYFHRLTEGKWSPGSFSNAARGGYSEDSWVKLATACAYAPDAAFSSVSWGKFQVMGFHWSKLGYVSPFDLAVSTVGSEAAHYELLARYIETFGLKDDIRRLSTNPADCRDFAAGYNGSAYEAGGYHRKLAEAMR